MKMRKRLVALLLVVAMVLSMAAPALAATPTDTGSLPADVAADIQRLIDAGIVSGYPDGTFKPDGTLTRGDFAKYVVNAAGLAEEKPATPSFKDVGASMANYGFIEAAAKAKIIQGFLDGTYGPTVSITKGQAAVIALRLMGKSPGGSYANEVKAAVAEGLLESAAVSAQTATRAQAAVVIVDTGLVPATPKAATVTITSSATTDTIAKGSSIKLTAAVKDASGNAVAGATVVWSADKGVIAADGTYAATEAGAVTITAKSGDISATKTITVYGPAVKLLLTSPASLTANGSAKGVVKATAVDAAGNVDPTYTGTITFSTTAGLFGTVASVGVKAANGVAETSLTSAAAGGTATVSASATGLTGAVASTTMTAQTLTSIELSADPTTIAADGTSASTITVKALDQDGKAINVAAAVNVTLTSSNTAAANFGGAATAPVVIALGTSSITQNLNATNNIGTTTISGAVTTAGQTSVVVKPVTVNSTVVGAPYKLAIDTVSDAKAAGTLAERTQSVVVRILDANGNQVTNPAAYDAVPSNFAITLAADKASATIATATLNAAAGGKATFTVTDTKAETVTYTVTGTIGNFTLTKATATGKFVPGAAANVTISASPAVISANGTSTSTLTAKIVDASVTPNTVTDGTFAVDFTKSVDNGATAAFTKTTVNTVNGVATVTVTSTTKVSVAGDQFHAAVTSISAASAVDATVSTGIFGPAYGLSIGSKGGRNGTAGTDVTVNVSVTDGNGTVLTNDNGRAVNLTVTDSKGATAGTFSANTVNGVAAVKVNLTKTGEYDFEANSTGLVKDTDLGPLQTVGGVGAVTIAAATASQVKVTSDVSTLAADTSSQATITVTLLDQYGNTATAAAATTVKLTPNSQNYAAFQGVVGTDGSISKTIAINTSSVTTIDSPALGFDSLKATANPGLTTITASSSGLTSASIDITTSVIGSAAKLAVQTVSDTTAGGNQSIKVNVLDANGARVTSSTANVTLTYKRTGDAANQTATVAAVKGQASFTVTDATAETLTYTATSGTLLSSTGTGKFVPGAAAAVTVAIAPTPIVGNGSSIATVTIKVIDGNGNLVSSTNGTATAQITINSDYAFLPGAASDGKLSVQITNGVGTAIIQAKDLSLAAGAMIVTVTGTFKPDTSTTWTSTGTVTVNKP